MSRAVSLFLALPVAVAFSAACGNGRPPAAELSASGATGATTGFGNFGGSTPAATKPPGCGQKGNGEVCDCVDVPLFGEPPNLYFVLDRSGSMRQDDKWSQVRVVVAEIFRGLGPRANFGVTVFPGSDASSCAPAREVVPLSPGDPPGSVDGPTTKKFLATTSDAPNGGTPTAEALRAALESLKRVTGKTFVVLATDGGPNCNETAACAVDRCMANIESAPGCAPGGPNCCEPPSGTYASCLDVGATQSAVAALKSSGFPVYVIGLPGAAVYSDLLDQLAVSGGTARTGASHKFYNLDAATDGSALLKTLKQIAAKLTATCTISLAVAPAQAELVNVYLDETVLPQEPVNGWRIEGSVVTLLGKACENVLSGDTLDVRVITGCPTVMPR